MKNKPAIIDTHIPAEAYTKAYNRNIAGWPLIYIYRRSPVYPNPGYITLDITLTYLVTLDA